MPLRANLAALKVLKKNLRKQRQDDLAQAGHGLSVNNGQLEVSSTPNQDSPINGRKNTDSWT